MELNKSQTSGYNRYSFQKLGHNFKHEQPCSPIQSNSFANLTIFQDDRYSRYKLVNIGRFGRLPPRNHVALSQHVYFSPVAKAKHFWLQQKRGSSVKEYGFCQLGVDGSLSPRKDVPFRRINYWLLGRTNVDISSVVQEVKVLPLPHPT